MTDEHDFGLRSEFYTFAPETLAQELPDFELVREVGKGSMGIVFEARRKADQSRIALKILPPSLTLTERALARFLREARVMARIRHPAIVQVHEHDRRGRLHYFAMEFVDGVTLQERLEVGPLPVRQACEICAEVGRALQFAHEHGVVHRDLKPGNVMLRQTGAPGASVAITDFGLARETGTGAMTESGAIVGTPVYMAPETVLEGTVQSTTLADVYGLGATLYTLVTGAPPYDGPTAQSVLKQLLERDPPRPGQLRADLPVEVEAIVLKAMERDPRRRYGSAQELSEDLDRFLRGERVQARRPSPLYRAWRTCRRHQLLTALTSLVLVMAVAGAVLLRSRANTELQADLAQAERLLALAWSDRDEQDRPRTADKQRDLLQGAVAAASAVIARNDSFAMAWFIRAKAHHRLRKYSEAIFDLDVAERLMSGPTPEVLQFRIDALQRRGDRVSVHRLQNDLLTLLKVDPCSHTRGLVAEHLCDLAQCARDQDRETMLATARDVLGPLDDAEPHTAIARARLLELTGDRTAALEALRVLRRLHQSNLFVHQQASRMFERLGSAEESRAEQEMVMVLSPGPGDRTAPAEMDLEGVTSFPADVKGLLETLQARNQQPGR